MMSRLTLCALLFGLAVLAGCERQRVTPDRGPTPPKVVQPPAMPAGPTVQPTAPPKLPPTQPDKATPPKTPAGKSVTLTPTKDARVFLHPSEAEMNGGASGRLRTSGLQKSSGEVSLVDFDRSAIKAFLDANAGRTVTATLKLAVYESQGGGKVELATLDTASPWNEGKNNQQAADKGEVCAVAAQKDVKKWTTPDGKEVADIRELIYDRKADKVKTLLNSKSVEVADKAPNGTVVEVELDAKLLEHLANSPTCQGLVLFNRTASSKIDFCSREQNKKGPQLLLSAK